jgi:hypothetical protein
LEAEVWFTCPYRKSNPLAVDRESGGAAARCLICVQTDRWDSDRSAALARHARGGDLMMRRANPERLRFASIDRLTLGGICRLFPKMYDTLAIVGPDTVIRWHRTLRKALHEN